MKILLKEDVEKLGVAGDIVSVADGFARNYLIPQGLAVKATAGQVKQVDLVRRQAKQKRDRLAAETAALAERLTGIMLTFEARASERGRLYGSITQDAITEALEAKLGEPFDRRKLETDPLREVGMHSIPVRLSGGLAPELVVVVHREGEDPMSYLPVEEEEEPEDEAAAEMMPDELAEEIDADALAEEVTEDDDSGDDSADPEAEA